MTGRSDEGPRAPKRRTDASALRDRMIPGQRVHNLIVLTGRAGRVPAPLFLLVALGLAVATGQLFSARWWAGGLLAGAVVLDAALLWSLPRLGVSFGPVNGPLGVFTLGRLLLALPMALLPGPWDVAVLAGVQAGLWGCSLWGHLVAPFRVQVVRVAAPILRQDPERPVRLVLLTDLHMERPTRREATVLELLDSLAPDLVLFGGDLLNLSYLGDPEAQDAARVFMGRIARRYPLVVVYGNPTVEDRATVSRIWESLDIAPLEGAQRVTLHGAPLVLFGLGASLDPAADVAALAALRAETPIGEGDATVLLYHLPDGAGQTPGFELTLCGHTHGGQIRLPLLGPIFTASKIARRLAAGTHRTGDTLLHVSRGLGMEGLGAPRMRFLCRPEVTLVELTARDSVPIPLTVDQPWRERQNLPRMPSITWRPSAVKDTCGACRPAGFREGIARFPSRSAAPTTARLSPPPSRP